MNNLTNVVEPFSDRVLVQPVEVETVTKGGIIIPDAAKEASTVGIVVAVGEGRDGVKMKSAIGDKIAYSKYGGVDVDVEGNTYKVLRETDIILRYKAPSPVSNLDGDGC